MFGRYLLVAHVPGRGWVQHPKRRRFVFRASAITFAVQSGHPLDPMWCPVPSHGRVHGLDGKWVPVLELPPW